MFTTVRVCFGFLALSFTIPDYSCCTAVSRFTLMPSSVIKLTYYTVVATRTYSGLKPSISPSNVALNSNPGTVLETACPEDSKTPPTC